MSFVGKILILIIVPGLLLPVISLAEQTTQTDNQAVTSVEQPQDTPGVQRDQQVEQQQAEQQQVEQQQDEQAPAPAKVVRVTYTASTLNLDNNSARTVITNYYNNYGVWAGVFRIDRVKNIHIKYYGNRRAVVHAKYSYKPIDPGKSHKPGEDSRTFTLIKHKDWSVITMGQHRSATLK